MECHKCGDSSLIELCEQCYVAPPKKLSLFALKSILLVLENLQTNEVLWVLNTQLPKYLCFVCGNMRKYCKCQDDND